MYTNAQGVAIWQKAITTPYVYSFVSNVFSLFPSTSLATSVDYIILFLEIIYRLKHGNCQSNLRRTTFFF
jgi:hypothetical protein